MLCSICFVAALCTGQNVFTNAWRIFWCEMLFVIGYVGIRWKSGLPFGFLSLRSIGFWLVALWVVGITLSLILSPYGLMMEWHAVQRYFQTLMHVLFCLCLMGFFKAYDGETRWIPLAIAVSVALLAVWFIIAWQRLSEPLPSDSREWFYRPPLNAHMRIIGFLVAAAAPALLPFFAQKKPVRLPLIGYYVMGLLICGLMFWTGGRGTIIASIVVCGAMALVLKLKKQRIKGVVVALVVLVVGGIVLAELFKVFYWNGIFQAAERTLAAGGDPYKLTTGRTRLWGWVIESLNAEDAWWFGLGSQGYSYMPNRTFAFDPHNLAFQFLAEWGVVGMILFFGMLGYGFFVGARRHLFSGNGICSTPVLASFGIILSLGAHSLVDGIFYQGQSSFYIAVAYALWMGTRSATKPMERSSDASARD